MHSKVKHNVLCPAKYYYLSLNHHKQRRASFVYPFIRHELVKSVPVFMPVAGLSFYACTIGCGLVLAAAGAAGLVFIRPWLRFLPLRVFLILSAAVWACSAF